MRTASMMSSEELAKHIHIPPRPPAKPRTANAAPDPGPRYTLVFDERFKARTKQDCYYFCKDGVAVSPKEFHAFQQEAVHALNHHEQLRGTLACAGAVLVDAGVEAKHPIFASIDKRLADSKA